MSTPSVFECKIAFVIFAILLIFDIIYNYQYPIRLSRKTPQILGSVIVSALQA